MPKFHVKKLIQIALLIAIEIVLTRLCSFQALTLRISFGFIPIALTGMMYGPIWAGCAALIGDLIGVMLFPTGAFFPGFSLTAFLTGVTYGFFLHDKDDWWRIIVSVGIISVFLHVCLDTFWLYLITGRGYLALLLPRILKNTIMAPVQVLLLRLLSSRVYVLVKKMSVT